MTDGGRFKKREVIKSALSLFPHRCLRLARTILPIWDAPYKRSVGDYLPDVFLTLLDTLFIGDLYVIAQLIIKPKIRHLTAAEYTMAEEVFGDQLDLKRVMIDDKARLLVIKYSFAYVSFDMVNYHLRLSNAVLIHELVHVLQYQRFGAKYIYRALKAQASKEGYDYGGKNGLCKALDNDQSLWEFNFEQQAQIIEDGWRVNQNFSWQLSPDELQLYHYYMQYVMKSS